jgi:cytoskeletal protein RodZ
MNFSSMRLGPAHGILGFVLCVASTAAMAYTGTEKVSIPTENASPPRSERLMLADSKEFKEYLRQQEAKEKEEKKKKKEEEKKAKEEQKKAKEARKHKQKAPAQPTAKPAVTTPAPAAAPTKAAAPVAAPAAAAAPVAAAAPAQPALVVKTYPMSSVGAGYATLNGHVSCPNKKGRAWFEWGDSPSFGQGTPARPFSGEIALGDNAYGLQGGTTYYYRAVADCGGNFVYGETRNFKKTY